MNDPNENWNMKFPYRKTPLNSISKIEGQQDLPIDPDDEDEDEADEQDIDDNYINRIKKSMGLTGI